MKKTHRMTIETGNEQILKDRRGRQWQTTPGLKNCLGNPDIGSPGVYSDSNELLQLLSNVRPRTLIFPLCIVLTWTSDTHTSTYNSK